MDRNNHRGCLTEDAQESSAALERLFEEMVSALQGYEDTRSARLNVVCSEYLQLIDHVSPALDESERFALFDALLSTYVDDDTTISYAWANVQEVAALG